MNLQIHALVPRRFVGRHGLDADIVTDPQVGALDADLRLALQLALEHGRPEACVRHARQFTWERCTDQLLANFVPVGRG